MILYIHTISLIGDSCTLTEPKSSTRRKQRRETPNFQNFAKSFQRSSSHQSFPSNVVNYATVWSCIEMMYLFCTPSIFSPISCRRFPAVTECSPHKKGPRSIPSRSLSSLVRMHILYIPFLTDALLSSAYVVQHYNYNILAIQASLSFILSFHFLFLAIFRRSNYRRTSAKFNQNSHAAIYR